MKRDFATRTLFLMVLISFALAGVPAAAAPDSTYSENFDTAANWTDVTGNGFTSYGTKTYSSTSYPAITFRGELSLRQTANTQDGFAATHNNSTYAWRLQDASGSLWQAKVTTGGVGTFSVWVRRWDNSPDPNYIVEYSINNGTSWTSVQTINNAWLGSSDWKQLSGTINTSNGAGDADDIIIRIRRVSGERLMVDDFEMTDYASAEPNPPLINEFVLNHTGTDAYEYLEARGDPSTDYSAYTILQVEGDSGANEGQIISLHQLGATNANGYWTTGYLAEVLQNGTLTLLLVKNFTGSVNTDLDTNDDGIFEATPWATIADAVAVSDGGAGDITYGSTVLDPAFAGGSFAPGGASRIPDGTDTDSSADWMLNDFNGAGIPALDPGTPVYGEAYNTPGAVNAVVPPAIIINEIDSDTPSTDVAEFIELYDGGAGNTALDGLVVVLYNGNGDVSYGAFDLDGRSTDAAGYFIICGNAANVANCDWDVSPDQDLIQNGADAVALFTANASDFPNGTGVTTANLVDAIVYDTDDADDAGLLVLLNAGQPQVNEGSNGASDTESNQRCPNGSGGARNTSTYSQSTPTPGSVNNCPADVPPTITSTVPTSGATGISTGTTITVNFSEIVDATASAFTVACPVGTPVTFTSNPTLPANDTSSIVLTPSSPLPAGVTCTVTAVAIQITDNDGTIHQLDGDKNGTGGDNYVFTFTTAGGFTKIHAIQGSGSAVVPGTFTVEAIVTGDYQGVTGVDDYKLDGFFIQEEDADADANAATSEGIFVYCLTCPTNVVVGDKVQVTGASSEYFGMSQLNATTAGAVVVVSQNNALPTPVALTLPAPGVTATDLAGAQAQINAYYEPFEGMLVKFPAQLSVTEYFELSRYGQVVLAQGGRFRQFTDANAPSASGYTAHQIDLAKRTVILDDDSNQQNHALFENVPVFHPVPGFSITNYVRGGDTITDLTGVLHWSFAGLTGTDAWRVRPVMNASNAPVYPYTFTSGNPRGAAADVGGNIKAASFNVLNYFTTLGSRGANSTAELDRQAAKIVAAFAGLNADVIGVMEIENNNDGAIADLVGRLNASAGAGAYAYIATGTVGDDEITVGIIYKTAKVTPIGAVQTLTAAAFTDPNNTGSQRNRPAVAQTFEENAWGERFTVVVNHLKSKGSCPSSGPDIDQGDGQGCWNDTRQKAAAYMVGTWIPTLAASSGDPDFLIVGDLNAYRKEDPITNIKNAGYADLLDTWLGAPAYGYVFDGQLGYLDHALSNASLTPQVTGATEWHINADEVNLLDYNDTVQDSGEQDFNVKPSATTLYEANAYRSSDHDPVLVGLGLYPDLSDLAAYGLAWHTGQGTPWRLGTGWTGDPTSGTGTDSDDGVARNYADSWNDTRGEVYVTVTGPAGKWACLNAWLDYSDGSATAGTVETPDGQFNTNEHVVNNLPIGPGTSQLVTFPLESGVIDSAATYNMRFRLVPAPDPNVQSCVGVTLAAAAGPLAPDGGASPTGRADGGEVEDHSFNAGPLAITLAYFTAAMTTDGVTLTWETLSEVNNAGFNVYRADASLTAADDGSTGADPLSMTEWVRLNPALIPAAAPGSPEGQAYSYTDTTAEVGMTYWYMLVDITLDGAATQHPPLQVTVGEPNALGLAAFGAAALPPAAGPSLAGLAALALAALTAGGRRQRPRI